MTSHEAYGLIKYIISVKPVIIDFNSRDISHNRIVTFSINKLLNRIQTMFLVWQITFHLI